MKTLSIIGCGRVGKTLGRLFSGQKIFSIQSILNRSLESSEKAVAFIGSGKAVEYYNELAGSDLYLISCVDSEISSCVRKLNPYLSAQSIVFHCSGSLSSSELLKAQDKTQLVASIHPIKSFVESENSVKTFEGTCCAMEGDADACSVLQEVFEKIDGRIFLINPEQKILYHAGINMVCQNLVSLLEVGFQCLETAGIPQAAAMDALKPLVTETVQNVFLLGTKGALTGPVARGDSILVDQHVETLRNFNLQFSELYRMLAQSALEMLKKGKSISP